MERKAKEVNHMVVVPHSYLHVTDKTLDEKSVWRSSDEAWKLLNLDHEPLYHLFQLIVIH